MNKKLTFPELAELLSSATNTSKRMSELALRETFAIISQSLVEGENVKIQDIGTFKVTSVSPRKSVDVNTGKAIEIPGHNKVTFTPDKRLAEAVNASFSAFESVVLDDEVTVQMLGEIDSSVVNASSEPDNLRDEPLDAKAQESVASVPVETDIDYSETLQQTAVQADKEDEDVSVEASVPKHVSDISADTDAIEPQLSSLNEDDNRVDVNVESAEHEQNVPSTEQSSADRDVNAEKPEETAESMAMPQNGVDEPNNNNTLDEIHGEEKEKKEYRRIAMPSHDDYDEEDDDISWWSRHKTVKGFLWGTIFGFCLCILCNMVQKYVANNAVDEVAYTDNEKVVPADTFISDIDSATYAKIDSSLVTSGMKKTNTEQVKEKVEKNVEVRDTVTATNFLTRMARRHYGNSHFWVYIYEENKSKISNPNNVKPGTVLVIPDAKKYGIDKDDIESVKKAIKKEGEIQSKYI